MRDSSHVDATLICVSRPFDVLLRGCSARVVLPGTGPLRLGYPPD